MLRSFILLLHCIYSTGSCFGPSMNGSAAAASLCVDVTLRSKDMSTIKRQEATRLSEQPLAGSEKYPHYLSEQGNHLLIFIFFAFSFQVRVRASGSLAVPPHSVNPAARGVGEKVNLPE